MEYSEKTAEEMESLRPALQVSHLDVFYKKRKRNVLERAGRKQALFDVSFELKDREVLGLVGESGCGKSTLARTIVGINKDYQGTIIQKYPRPQMVFQDPYGSLNPARTVEWLLKEPLRVDRSRSWSEQEQKERLKEVLEQVELSRELLTRYPSQLSGGQRQRVSIGAALMQSPRLLIADEPVSALDVTIQAQIMELIVRLNEQLNMGVMLITHDLAVVAQTCSRVIVMYLGQIVEEADVLTLFDHPCHPYTEGLMRSIPRMEGDRTKPLYMIPGTVPLLSQIPTGCRFAPRCAYATERCRQETPQLTPVSDKQSVRCFRAAELAQKEATAQ